LLETEFLLVLLKKSLTATPTIKDATEVILKKLYNGLSTKEVLTLTLATLTQLLMANAHLAAAAQVLPSKSPLLPPLDLLRVKFTKLSNLLLYPFAAMPLNGNITAVVFLLLTNVELTLIMLSN
jgi:hypothetical protein